MFILTWQQPFYCFYHYQQINLRIQTAHRSRPLSISRCRQAITPPGLRWHTLCPVLCLHSWRSTVPLLLLSLMEWSMWLPPWRLKEWKVKRPGYHSNKGEGRRGRVNWRWASNQRGMGWMQRETSTGENVHYLTDYFSADVLILDPIFLFHQLMYGL